MRDKPDPEVEALKKRLEESERENSMLKAAIRASPAGILIASAPDGVIEMWNAAALGIRGDAEEDLTKIPLDLHPTRWQTFHANGEPYEPEDLPLSRALLKGEVVQGDDVIIRNEQGDERWVNGHAAPVRDDKGNVVGGVVVFPDVTESKKAELTAQRFRRMADSSPDFVGIAEPTGKAIYVNAAGRALAGVAPDLDIEEKEIASFHPQEVLDLFRDVAFPAAIESGYWSGETELLHADGSRIPVSQDVIAHRDANGELEYLSTVMRDLRPMRELELQLRQSQKLESLGRIAGGVAHDFNNLLTVIINYTQLVERSLPAGDQRGEDLKQVRFAGRRAADLCDRLLSFARRQIIKPETIHLRSFIEELSELFRRTIGEDIQLDLDIAPDVWPIKVDPSQLSQVFMNLVVNAREAMPEGGHLMIEAHNVVLDEAFREGHREVSPGQYIVIAVSDTGHGMAPEVQERVFEPFFTTKPSHGGTGLGLATVHGAVRQNQGHIWLYSETGKGTSFKMYWPRSDVDATRSDDTEEPRAQRGVGTVLVVEDEDALRALTVRLLEEGGYSVMQAKDGVEALELVASFDGVVDLLVTDVIMPRMNGRVLADSLLESYPDLAVLYVSGYTENTIVHRGVLEPGVEFLAKPFSRESLLSRVGELI